VFTKHNARIAGRIAAFTTIARYGASAPNEAARAALLRRVDATANVTDDMDPHDREARIRAARSAYFTRLALKSKTARAARRLSSPATREGALR
jgi:hypothetical protein